jgi:hypothetical protein
MKSLLFACLLVLTAPAAASTVTATFVNVSPHESVQTSTNSGASWSRTQAGVFNFTGEKDFAGFCIDLADPISPGQTSVWDQAPISSLGPRADDLSRLLGGALGSTLNPSALNSVAASALQLAIWEIVSETSSTYSMGSGSARFQAPAASLAQAGSWLANLSSYTPMPGLSALTHPDVQDFVVQLPNPVPLPPAALLFGTALLGLAGIARKRS